MTTEEYREKYDPAEGLSDAALEALLAAAQSAVEAYLGRGLGLAERTEEHWSETPRRVIALRAWPVTAVASVADEGGARSDFILLAAQGQLFFHAPAAGMVRVAYTGGLEPVPADVERAMALIVSALGQAQESGGQTIVSERLGDWQATYASSGTASAPAEARGLASLSQAAAALLDPYRARRA